MRAWLAGAIALAYVAACGGGGTGTDSGGGGGGGTLAGTIDQKPWQYESGGYTTTSVPQPQLHVTLLATTGTECDVGQSGSDAEVLLLLPADPTAISQLTTTDATAYYADPAGTNEGMLVAVSLALANGVLAGSLSGSDDVGDAIAGTFSARDCGSGT